MVNALKLWWTRLSALPFGKWIFSRVVGLLIPYTGSVSPNVEKISPGFAEVFIKDKRRNRNHLRCIHALALGNLGEFTTGLALHFSLRPDRRAILTSLHIEFLKKARGKITGKATIDLTSEIPDGPIEVLASLADSQGEVVTKVTATWLVGNSNNQAAK